jgi:hypothetical protein
VTPEEKKRKKREYLDRVMADPFRRKLYLDYFRKRRARPGMRERTNEQARARYHKDIEKSRAENRAKQARLYADPEKRAARNARRRANRKRTNAYRRGQIKYKLIPRWETVVAEGREEAYLRRTTPQNAALFSMWVNNPTMFYQMIEKKIPKR